MRTISDISSSPHHAAGPAQDALDSSRAESCENPVTPFNLFWIFVVCSVIGLVVETLVSYPIDGVWKNRAGLVWGPFSPIYGVGAVLMTMALHKLRARPAWESFVVAALVGGAFELVAGWFWKNAFGIVAWSYIDQPFNIGGYTCLGIAIVWGIAGMAWIKVGLPLTMRLIAAIPPNARVWLTAFLVAFLALDVVVTLASFSFWFDRQAGLPITTGAGQFFAQYFGDEFMTNRFQTMSMWTELAQR
jgi:uncharacterized membrane protein